VLRRPPRLVPREDKAHTCRAEVASEILERLLGGILEASDPWRALDDVRRRLSVEPGYLGHAADETSAPRGDTSFHGNCVKDDLPCQAARRLTFAFFTIGKHNRQQ